MALMFEYKPGMSLTDPWPFTVVRASPAYRITKDGTLVQVAANVLRDNHYPFGLGSAIRTTLFEPTVINVCLQSQALATTWTPNALTPTNNVSAAPDGTVTASGLVPDATNVNGHRVSQAITITSAENCAISGFFQANGYTGLLLRATDAGGTNSFALACDVSTGAKTAQTVGAGAVVGSVVIPLANGWYWFGVWGTINAGVTAANLFLNVFDTYAHAQTFTAYAGDAVSGIRAWGLQFERNGTAAPKAASSYVPTAAGTATRSDESAATPWPNQTQAMWAYTSWYDLGGSIWLQSAPLVTLTGSVVNLDPSWCPMFLRNNGKPGASWAGGTVTPQNGLLGSSRNTIAPNAGLATVQPYDFVETFSRVLKDGSTYFDARINGGTVFTNGPVGPTGGIPFADIVNPLLYLGRPAALTGPQVGATCVRIGADPTKLTTLAQAAAV